MVERGSIGSGGGVEWEPGRAWSIWKVGDRVSHTMNK